MKAKKGKKSDRKWKFLCGLLQVVALRLAAGSGCALPLPSV